MKTPTSNSEHADVASVNAKAAAQPKALADAQRRADSIRLIVIAVVVTIVALVGLLSPLPRAWYGRLGNATADLMHVPAFAILTTIALAIVNRFYSQRFSVHLFVALLIVGAGAGIEVIQAVLGRSASWHDAIANTAGAVSALMLRYSLGSETVLKRLSRVMAVIIFLVASSGPSLTILDTLSQRRSPSELAKFATRAEFQRWFAYHAEARSIANPFSRNLGSDHQRGTGEMSVRRDANAALVTLRPGDYPMFQLQHLTSRWSDYHEFRFLIGRPKPDNPEPLVIQLRIRDWAKQGRQTDSYYKRFTLLPGDEQEFRITMDELRQQSDAQTLNLDNIRFVEFLAVDMQQSSSFVIAELQLLTK